MVNPRVSDLIQSAACHRPRAKSGSVKLALFEVMTAEPGEFRTVLELAARVGADPAGVSARLRGDLKRYAAARGWTILRDRLRGDASQSHRYAMRPTLERFQ